MPQTTVVFVHGFRSGPECWNDFISLLEKDPDLERRDFHFARYKYFTALAQINPAKRLPTIKECGNGLGTFLDTRCPEGKVVLVGHSMGGLVIQNFLAEKLSASLGADLARIRSVILFATPNRGSTMLSSLRRIVKTLVANPQEEQLEVLDEEVAALSETIVRSILGAKRVDRDCCPIPFRVFWGEEDAVVPEASARGSFTEASVLPGDHDEIIHPKDRDDQRYICFREELLNPVGHPFIYEFDRFEVGLAIRPNSSSEPILLNKLDQPFAIYADNVAIRSIKIDVSKKNRCSMPYEQMYRSQNGYVESLSFTAPNQVSKATESENRATGRKFTYVFMPDKEKKIFLNLQVYNGYGKGQRSWHNHMNSSAHYKLFRFTLDLQAYERAGYTVSPEPSLYYYDQDIADHELCGYRQPMSPLPYLQGSTSPFLRTWEIPDLHGGVVDIVWDLQEPPHSFS